MSFPEIVVLALALAADAFSVGAVVGLNHRGARQILRLSFHFGLFQALLPLAGASVGVLFRPHVETWGHWVVLAILSAIGVKMILGARRRKERAGLRRDLTRGLNLIGLSLAVSIDALAAGVGLALGRAPLVLSAVVIGLVAALATLIAMLGARWIGKRMGRGSEFVAGFVLIGLGLWTALKAEGLLAF